MFQRYEALKYKYAYGSCKEIVKGRDEPLI